MRARCFLAFCRWTGKPLTIVDLTVGGDLRSQLFHLLRRSSVSSLALNVNLDGMFPSLESALAGISRLNSVWTLRLTFCGHALVDNAWLSIATRTPLPPQLDDIQIMGYPCEICLFFNAVDCSPSVNALSLELRLSDGLANDTRVAPAQSQDRLFEGVTNYLPGIETCYISSALPGQLWWRALSLSNISRIGSI